MNPETLQTILLVMGSSGVGGLVIGIYNAWVSARKGTVDEWRGLLAEQREVITEQNKVIDEQKQIIKEQQQVIAEQKKEIIKRDGIIDDLKDWATRLVRQLAVHAPGVKAEEYIRRGPQ